MSLNSFEFILFFVPLLLLRACVRGNSGDKWLLLMASIAFYLTWSVPGVVLVLLTSILGWAIGRRMEQTADLSARRRLLVANLAANIGLLGFFKYTNFFLENLAAALNAFGWHVGTLHYHIILPAAISYFTFASMSYAIDVYYERMAACRSIRDYALFMTFFPKLLSGPIQRAIDFLPQLEERKRARMEDIETGLTQFLVGAVKKMVIADEIAANVSLIFSAPGQYDRLTLVQGMIGYAVQLYCDFSGYSDMAIGCARILGYRLMENFQMPFSAVTITEFWRRWHISLSGWFRDYVFLPLEMASRGIRFSLLRVTLNLILTFVLVGLWHGASWGYVLFGLMHGLALSTHAIWQKWDPLASWRGRRIYSLAGICVSRVLTLGVFLFSIVLFRAPSVRQGFSYWRGMLSWNHHGVRMLSPFILPAIAVVFLVHLFVSKDRNWAQEIPARPLAIRVAACTALVLALAFFGSTDNVPFIYFQF